jgi:hypothetical protein
MTDRDTFAAAALTGLLAQGDDADFPENTYWAAAYRMADAMLRERAGTEPMPKEKRAEVSYTLTAEEREAVAYFATFHGSPREADAKHGKTLRALLERLK